MSLANRMPDRPAFTKHIRTFLLAGHLSETARGQTADSKEMCTEYSSRRKDAKARSEERGSRMDREDKENTGGVGGEGFCTQTIRKIRRKPGLS